MKNFLEAVEAFLKSPIQLFGKFLNGGKTPKERFEELPKDEPKKS